MPVPLARAPFFISVMHALKAFIFVVIFINATSGYSSGEGFNRPPLQPLPGPAQVIGFYSAGCLVGARALPLQGRGFTVMRPRRNRYYGHPNTIAFVQRLSEYAANQGQQLLIGDLSQPRGGPMTSGHRSHQSGLDVDIWYHQLSTSQRLSSQKAEILPMLSVVNKTQGTLNQARWSGYYRDVLKYAAEAEEVERIFVNPIIKHALCVGEKEDRRWLRKIRPWWGHDSHFHVRLRCPEDSGQCEKQKPPPMGDGCQEENLMEWIQEIRQAASKPSLKPQSPSSPSMTLPLGCSTVLQDNKSELP